MSERRAGRGRLTRSADFDRVMREGRSHGNRFVVLHAFRRPEDEGEPRLGVSVGRRIGGAVERNRVKRVLRECVARLSDELPGGRDYVVVARPEVAGLVERRGARGVEEALRELLPDLGDEDRGSAT